MSLDTCLTCQHRKLVLSRTAGGEEAGCARRAAVLGLKAMTCKVPSTGARSSPQFNQPAASAFMVAGSPYERLSAAREAKRPDMCYRAGQTA